MRLSRNNKDLTSISKTLTESLLQAKKWVSLFKSKGSKQKFHVMARKAPLRATEDNRRATLSQTHRATAHHHLIKDPSRHTLRPVKTSIMRFYKNWVKKKKSL